MQDTCLCLRNKVPAASWLHELLVFAGVVALYIHPYLISCTFDTTLKQMVRHSAVVPIYL